jgi:hypothetical protein
MQFEKEGIALGYFLLFNLSYLILFYEIKIALRAIFTRITPGCALIF